MEPSCSCYRELGPGAGVTPPSLRCNSATFISLFPCVCPGEHDHCHQMGTWEMYHGNGIVRGHGYRHLPIFPSAFHFGVLKSLKKEDVQSVRSIRCCSTWQLHDEQHEQSPDRPTAYLFSQTAQVYTSSVRCRNSTDEGRVKSVVLYL